eukprot:822350-Pyramimonas_sp.AAC.2
MYVAGVGPAATFGSAIVGMGNQEGGRLRGFCYRVSPPTTRRPPSMPNLRFVETPFGELELRQPCTRLTLCGWLSRALALLCIA